MNGHSAKSSDKINIGDHACSIYRNKEEQFRPVVNFFKDGLENNQRCVYVFNDSTRDEVISELWKGGIDTEKFLKSGQLSVIGKNDAYLRMGSFDPDEMISYLKEVEKKSMEDGYEGMRLTGEMTWALEKPGDLEKLIKYEIKLNNFFPNSRSAAICQYDENRFSQDVSVEALHRHPFVIIYGKLYKDNLYFSPGEKGEGVQKSIPGRLYELIIEDISKSRKKHNI